MLFVSMILSDLPSPAEASGHNHGPCQGFAQAGNHSHFSGSCSSERPNPAKSKRLERRETGGTNLRAKPLNKMPQTESQMANRDLVAVGTSAGGVDALSALVKGLPEAFPAALLVTIHLSDQFPSSLDEVLSRAGPLPARFAIAGET